MKDSFFEKAKLLDNLKKAEVPKIDKLTELLEGQSFEKYFFEDLENSIWVQPLNNINYFLRVPEPIEDPNNPGYFSNPAWWAGEYLKRMAMLFPETVRDVALKLDTENGRAIRTILEAIIQIPSSIAAQTVVSFDRWAKTRFVHSMMIVYAMGRVMNYLAHNGQIIAALEILRVITEPFPIEERLREGTILAGSRHDIYWLQKALFESASKLIEEAPLGVIEVIEKRLIESIDLEIHPELHDEDDFKNHSYWLLNIDPDLDSNYRKDIKNMLVNVLLKAFYQACKTQPLEASSLIERYLISEYAIFRRVAVHLLRIYGDNFKDLVEKVYQINKEKKNLSFRSEFERFLEAQFQNFSQGIKEEILEGIYTEKDEPQFIEWMEEWIGRNPERFEGETKQEKERSFIEEIRFRGLHRFAPHLFGRYLDDYNNWKEIYEPPEPVVEGVVTVTEVEGPKLPLYEDDIVEKTISEIIEILNGYEPPQDQRVRQTSRSDQGMVIEADVLKRCKEYAQNAMLFRNEELHFTYHTYLFRGFKNALKADKRFPMEYIIELAEYLVDVKEDKFERLEYEPGLDAVKEAIASFFDGFLRKKEPYLDEKSLDRIGGIIGKLLWVNDPYLEKKLTQIIHMNLMLEQWIQIWMRLLVP